MYCTTLLTDATKLNSKFIVKFQNKCFWNFVSSFYPQPYNNSLPLMLMDQFQLIQKLQVYLPTVSTHIKLHSWLNHQYSKIWINLHFFGPKVHFLRLFEAFMGKIFNKPPPWNPHILINLRRFICVGTVMEIKTLSQYWIVHDMIRVL